MQIIDTHCHYNLEPLYSGKRSHFEIDNQSPLLNMNWQNHWQKAQEKGISKSIIIGADLENSQKAIEIANQDQNLFASIGIHPSDSNGLTAQQIYRELKNLAQGNKIVAIGETGLDYFKLSNEKDDENKEIKKQKEFFEMHLQLANELRLPLIVHARDKTEEAYWEILHIIKNNYQQQKAFVLHCISGPISYIKQALDLGAYIGVAANVTYKKANDIREIVKYVPQDRLLIETDAPYLPPRQYRGQVCEPWMMSETALFLKKELGINIETTTNNAQNIFNLS